MQYYINLNLVLQECAAKIKWIIGAALLFFIASLLISKYLLTPMYTSSAHMLVDSSAESDQLNINDINASEKLLGTCVYLLTDDAVLEEVASKLGPSYNADRLRNVLRVEALSGTMIIRITAETDDPELSARICNEMAAAAPGALRRVIKSGSVEMVGAAKPAKDPSSPNVVVNSILGMLLGFASSVVIIALLRILDNTVKDEHDLKRVMDVPVLGEIPSIEHL